MANLGTPQARVLIRIGLTDLSVEPSYHRLLFTMRTYYRLLEKRERLTVPFSIFISRPISDVKIRHQRMEVAGESERCSIN